MSILKTIYQWAIVGLLLCLAVPLIAQVLPYGESQRINNGLFNTRPDIASNDDQEWIAVWGRQGFENGGINNGITIIKSPNIGKGWNSPKIILSTSKLASPKIATNLQGKWLITWRDGLSINYIQSTDFGETWSRPSTLNDPENLWRASEPVIAVNDTEWRIIWSEQTETHNRVRTSRSTDDGAIWSTPNTIQNYPKNGTDVFKIPEVNLAANQKGNWIAAWVTNNKNREGALLEDRLFTLNSDGPNWRRIAHIRQCEYIRSTSIASDGNNSFLLLWEEEDANQPIDKRNAIYQTFTPNNGQSWNTKRSAIRQGKNPKVVAVAANSWSFVAASTASPKLLPDTGTDDDIVLSFSNDNGENWGEHQLINSDGTTDNSSAATEDIDLFPVMAKNSAGAWVIVWLKNGFSDGNARTETYATLADHTPPIAGAIKPNGILEDEKWTTTQSTVLSFDWEESIDNQSGVVKYEYAFGTPANLEAYTTFKEMDDATKGNKSISFVPSQFPATFPDGYFTKGTYVYSIRTTNLVGLQMITAVNLEIRPLKVGEKIPLPNGNVWNDIDWQNTIISPRKFAALLADQEQLLAADYGDFPALTITWRFKNGAAEKIVKYGVQSLPIKEPMTMYHTHLSDNITRTKAPPIDVSLVDRVKIHYNKTVPLKTGNDKAFWRNNNVLNAAEERTENEAGKPAYILLELRNSSGFVGVEIVEIKPDLSEVASGEVDIGSRLLPVVEDPAAVEPFVSVNQSNVTGKVSIYQHPIGEARNSGELWAVRRNTNPSRMRVYWQRKGLGEIVWPYEIRLYTAPDWPKDSPEKYQLYVRSTDEADLDPTVTVPDSITAILMEFQEPFGHAELNLKKFDTEGEGWSLLKFEAGRQGVNWVGFEVVRSVLHDNEMFANAPQNAAIGTEITEETHEGPAPGYIHLSEGNRFAPKVYEETGQIFPVNKGPLEVWWSNLGRSIDPEGTNFAPFRADKIQWPSKVLRYDGQWPTAASGDIVIASQRGSGRLDSEIYGTAPEIYFENDATKVGFNPNEEHAIMLDNTIFPLRDDLGTTATSEPYILLKYKAQAEVLKWQFAVFKVEATTSDCTFGDCVDAETGENIYQVEAGKIVQRPFPISLLSVEPCPENKAISGPFFIDKQNNFWTRSAGDNGGTAQMTLQYHYPVIKDFYTESLNNVGIGDHIPWLDRGSGTAVDVSYTIHWPEDVPTMKIGQTILEAQLGLPQINGACSVDLLYEQSQAQGGGKSVLLIDPVIARKVFLAEVPEAIKMEDGSFTDLSLVLRKRISHEADSLIFKGEIVPPTVGFDYPLLNVMSTREKEELLALSTATTWVQAVEALYEKVKTPVDIPEGKDIATAAMALTSGIAEGVGYVTLAFQNKATCDGVVSLEIIKVIADIEANKIAVITPDCPFDETLTLRNTGDFGGKTDNYEFEWRYLPDEGGIVPDLPFEEWLPLNGLSLTDAERDVTKGLGEVDYTIKGSNLLTLSDNWIVGRFKTPIGDKDWSGVNSNWTEPQLAEGWIKRVIGDINAFGQRSGDKGGIEGAERRFSQFEENEVNTIVSMLEQAGERWTGNVPLSCSNLEDFGLIEIYETIMGRGKDLSIDGIPNVDYEPANTALLLVASRIADMYMLLGNEAFADAADPTIAFGTEDGVFGTRAASIHSFQNQTANLLEEELALLMGRDNSNAFGVKNHPVYNRLVWNFTRGDGEVAYASNYDIQDDNGNADGIIDEADAKKKYPQAHGDAWGHYLTAIKIYYDLLRHPKYTWTSRAEAILIGGTPITVDYLDERKFAKAAAAKAKVGNEVTNLIYRQSYTENPAGQWQGYKDEDADRAWGLSEWSRRTGQGAYFDWIVGNAILPEEDTQNTGVQKIDRTTVLDLNDIASNAIELQARVDEADLGLNPLGLAGSVVPFDISPTELDNGNTHFEQVYDRAITALENTVTVFNHASNTTQLLRRQSDNLEDFQRFVRDRESDIDNRLIEIFGYPYSDDIGPGKTYEGGYEGPDIYHFNYVDASDLMLQTPPDQVATTAYFKDVSINEQGVLISVNKEVVYHLSNSADQFGQIKPSEWTGQRRAPGALQMIRSDLIQAKSRLDIALVSYDNLLADIEAQAANFQAQLGVNAEEINILEKKFAAQTTLQAAMVVARGAQLGFKQAAATAKGTADALQEALPTSVGLANDVSSIARGALKATGSISATTLTVLANIAEVTELAALNATKITESRTNIELTSNRISGEEQAQLKQLESLVREEAVMRLELQELVEVINQTSGSYLATLAEGQRLLEERTCFRQQTASDIQSQRYKDMAFRIFRNDALQKYKAQFDLAAKYAYLAAKAYDYETTWLAEDSRSGANFLTDIVRKRLIGTVDNGQAAGGLGLAGSLQKMKSDFDNFKGQLRINNEDKETSRFSFRNEFFRIPEGEEGDQQWRDTMRQFLVANVLDLPEFQRYCRPFSNGDVAEPAIVIPFETTISSGLNFFGKVVSQGGDNTFDVTKFSTKIRSVGVEFEDYNNTAAGLVNTPNVYLIPVGVDVQRVPGSFEEIRTFKILDQILPSPSADISQEDLNDRFWLPATHTTSNTVGFATRRYSSFRAAHDADRFNTDVTRNSSLVGRSVWNTQWLLIIPAHNLLNDRQEAIERFIDGQLSGAERNGMGITDIRLLFETYSFSGF